jgi:hypothetical protein
MKRFCPVFFVALIASFVGATAFAESIPPYEVIADGKEYQIILGPKERNITDLSVYFVSTGNISTAVEIRVAGPKGIKGSVRGGVIGPQNAAEVVALPAALQPIRTRISNTKDAPDFGLTTSSDDARVGSAYVWYHLQKDNCSGGKTDRYVSQVKLDLTGIDPALYDLTFAITLSLKEFKFSGAMVASIKPSSDGKYKGEPILLMASIGSPEYVNIVSWRNKKIASSRRIPVVKYVGYKGYGLSLARLRGVLNGGRATFELSNGGDIYGVCFTAVRRRQSANGYPAPN